MADADDKVLLAEYARNGSEQAFSELVARHVNLVYSAALRATGNPHDAEEVTQAVFLVLARKAGHLRSGTVLPGWLYTTARHTAANCVRERVRRQRREQEACMQSNVNEPRPTIWEQIAPWLEEGMASLGEMDRNALLLRFFQNKTNREVGAELNISESAAHQRVSRALEKLRRLFANRGVSLTGAGFAAVISSNSLHAAPAGLAQRTAEMAASVVSGGSVAILARETINTIFWMKMKWGVVAGLLAAGVITLVELNRATKPQVLALAASERPQLRMTATAPPSFLANTYELVEIKSLPGFDLHVSALNNRGQVVGSVDSPTNHETHSFVWEHGVVTDLGSFGAVKSLATGINDSGDIVGLFLKDGARHVFVRHDNEVTDIGVIDQFSKLGDEGDKYNGGPGIIYYAPRVSINGRSQVAGRLTDQRGNQRSFMLNEGRTSYFGVLGDGSLFDAESINDRGQILGRARKNTSPVRSMLWQNGEMIDLSLLGGTESHAAAMNDRGMVVGSLFYTNGPVEGFLWQNGKVQTLPRGKAGTARPAAINNAGQIAGWAEGSDKRSFACVWAEGEILDLNELVRMEPGWHLSSASAINDRGQILARGARAEQRRDFLISPLKLLPLLEDPAVVAIAPGKGVAVESFNLSAFESLPNGAFRLTFAGTVGGKYVIEASTNLVDWISLGPATNDAGKMAFTDAEASRFTLRFYRAAKLR